MPYRYLAYVNNPDNNDKVLEIITAFKEGDLITDEVIKRNLEKLETLKTMGEDAVYSILKKELRQTDTYKNFVS